MKEVNWYFFTLLILLFMNWIVMLDFVERWKLNIAFWTTYVEFTQ